jgi:hypothetical protein
VIAALADESDAAFAIAEFRTSELAPGVVLATYRATAQVADAAPRRSLRSSLWVRRSERWQLRFHQGTATAALG